MVKNPDIEAVLAEIRHNPKNTTDFLLGTICADVCTIKERQVDIDKKIDNNTISLEKKIAAIQLEVDEIKSKNTFDKGFLAAITTIGGIFGAAILAFGKYIWGILVVAH